MEQQALLNRIYELAIATSLAQRFFVYVKYNGLINQISVAILFAHSRREKSREAVDLHAPNDPEFAQRRVTQNLMRVVTHLESLQAKPLQQRSLSL
jgi:hypothetical protein